MRDRNTGDPRGFAFVVFKTDDTVDLILSAGPHEINHKVVDIKRAQARGVAPPSIHHGPGGDEGSVSGSVGGGGGGGGQQPGHGGRSHKQSQESSSNVGLTPEQLKCKVFVGGLPLHVDKDGMKDFFSVFGPVTDAIVMMDMNQHRSRGFGFVTFENGSGGAQKAIEAQPINMFGKMVEVKLATPKGDRDGGGGGGGVGGGNAAGGGNFNNKPFNRPSGPQVVMAPSAQSTGEFAGLASSFGRAGWRAGYGSKAFGKAGWSVLGWDDGGEAPEKSGFSFECVEPPESDTKNDAGERVEEEGRRGRDQEMEYDGREAKRARQ